MQQLCEGLSVMTEIDPALGGKGHTFARKSLITPFEMAATARAALGSSWPQFKETLFCPSIICMQSIKSPPPILGHHSTVNCAEKAAAAGSFSSPSCPPVFWKESCNFKGPQIFQGSTTRKALMRE